MEGGAVLGKQPRTWATQMEDKRKESTGGLRGPHQHVVTTGSLGSKGVRRPEGMGWSKWGHGGGEGTVSLPAWVCATCGCGLNGSNWDWDQVSLR